jgi:hypothetical protein
MRHKSKKSKKKVIDVPDDEKIGRTQQRASRMLEETSEKFVKCPKCKLPTFNTGDKGKVFCATCNDYFDIKLDKHERKKAVRSKPKKSYKPHIVIGSIAAFMIIILVALSVYYIFLDNERDLISIYDISDIRGLNAKRDLPPKEMSRDELEEYLRDSLDDEWKAKLRELEIFYKCMFIIEEDIDLIEIASNQSAGGIAGFYDPENEEMYVIGEGHTDQYMNYILSHEYTHALQDQNYDLEVYQETGAYDSETARLAAIEGDAMLTMNMWSEDNLDQTETFLLAIESTIEAVSAMQDMLDDGGGYSNEILSRMTYFPYTDGLEFVQQVYDNEGWEGVNQLFTSEIPMSTEQILHYEKYQNHEEPHDADFDVDLSGYSLKFTSSVGEKLLTEIINYYTGGGSSNLLGLYSSGGYHSAAAGWGGDKFYYYDNGMGNFLAVYTTSWDSEADNSEFNMTYSHILEDMGNFNNETGYYRTRGNYVYKISDSTTTTILYSDIDEIIQSVL